MSKFNDSDNNFSLSQNDSQKAFFTNESNSFKLLNTNINIKPISKIEDQNKINFTQIANVNNNNSAKALNFLKQNSIKKYEEDIQIKNHLVVMNI